MISNLLRRLRRQKSQRRGTLIPPDLCLRDSFASPFPHVSDGGYSLYYELELLQQKRAYEEAQYLATPSHRPIHKPHLQTQTPGASGSSSQSLPSAPTPLPPTLHVRRHGGTRRRSRRPVASAPSVALPGRSVLRKRKKEENLRRINAEIEALANHTERAASIASHHYTSQSFSASSSIGHSTVDTPPTTVEDLTEDFDLAVVDYEAHDVACADDGDLDGQLIDRPESRSSYYTVRSHFSDP